MKRLNPVARKLVVKQTADKLAKNFLCRYGEWNRNKLLSELSKYLKNVIKELENESK